MVNLCPAEVLDLFAKKGIEIASIQAAAHSDRDLSGTQCECYLVSTNEYLAILSGIFSLVEKKKTGFFPIGSRVQICSRFTELSYVQYRLTDLSALCLEELLSTCRLTAASSAGGGSVLLARSTNTCKDELSRFVHHVNSLQNGKPVITSKEDAKAATACPVCGARYPNPNRRFCPKCMSKTYLIRRLAGFFKNYTGSLVIMLLLLVGMSALGILSPYISSAFFYDEVLSKNGSFYGQVLLVLALIISVRLFSVVMNMVNGIISSRIAAKVTYDLKITIFNAIRRLSLGFFNGRQTGGLMTQVNSDAQTIHQFFLHGLTHLLINGVQILALLGVMLCVNPLLTLLSMLAIPLYAVMLRFCYHRLHELHAKRFSGNRALSGALSDILSGIRVVKAFSKEKQEVTRFNRYSKRLAQYDEDLSAFQTLAFPLTNFLLSLGGSLIWAFGGWMVMHGELTYGLFLSFVAYLNIIYAPLQSFAQIINMATDCMNACSRLFEIIDSTPDVLEAKHPVHLNSLKGDVSFRNVEFSYTKNHKVIDGISFDIEAGKTIGIVGHTGAGKSTLANLLIRLYDVSGGEICIDGINIKDLSFETLRKNIAIVSQETYLFAGTVLENIRYARPDATLEETLVAARIAGAHNFIMQLPDGYATLIGTGYKELSGGERQRISIARAVLRDPRILILDEATSAMDTETERQIHEALERLSKGRTTIMIAHRLSTLRSADKLIVIDSGKMPESGTHAELIAKKGIYHKLYRMQAEALKNIGIETWKGDEAPCPPTRRPGPPNRPPRH